MTDALIFDFGGVLWDMRWDWSLELEQQHGLRERAILETLYAGDTWRQIEVGAGDREAWLRGAHAQLEAIAGRELPPLHERWREGQRVIEPNIELIRALRGRYRTGVLSNADPTLPHRLRDIGIAGLFDSIVCSAEVGMAKPDPRIYALAAERLACRRPAACSSMTSSRTCRPRETWACAASASGSTGAMCWRSSSRAWAWASDRIRWARSGAGRRHGRTRWTRNTGSSWRS